MHSTFQFGNITVPAYGLMVILGIVIVNIVALAVAKRNDVEYGRVVLLELITGVGAILGAKIYSLLLTEMGSGWSVRITRESFSESGYAFYGGLILGLIIVIFANRLPDFELERYANLFGFLAPLLHVLWKIGCVFGGCCYGIEYEGIFAITFPEGAKAPANVSLFPVQYLEIIILVIITLLLFIWGRTRRKNVIELYLLSYGTTRAIIELLRFHNNRYRLWCNEIISTALVVGSIVVLVIKNRTQKSGGIEGD